MKEDWRWIWYYSYLFMDTFCEVKYDELRLSFLLLRSYQKYISRFKKHFPNLDKEKTISQQIQKMCQPYMIQSKPVFKQNGYTLLRANWYPLSVESEGRVFLYLAHHKKEYERMRKKRLCRPLVYLRHLPEAPISPHEENQVMDQLQHIWESNSTLHVFKRPAFVRWMKKKVKVCLKRIRQLRILFDHYPIREVIYGSTLNAMGVLVTSVAQKMNVFTVNMQHGVFGEVGHLPVNADLQLVWGEAHKKFLISYGAPGTKIRCVNPIFIQSINHEQIGFTDQTWTVQNEFHILVALQPFGYSRNKYMIETIEKAVRPFSNKVRIRYKLHPDQSKGMKLYSKLLKNKTSCLVEHGAVPLKKLMPNADLIITAFSTVAYEGVLCGKPVLFFGKQTSVYYLHHTPLFAHNVVALRKFIQKALRNSSFLDLYCRRLVLTDALDQPNKTDMKVWDVIDQYRAAMKKE